MRNNKPTELNLIHKGWKSYKAERLADIMAARDCQNPPITFQEIGDKWGITKSRAQQIYSDGKRAQHITSMGVVASVSDAPPVVMSENG
jgi:hypothetical protein